MNQYDKKTQIVAKSILGKTTHISKQCFEESYNYFDLLQIVEIGSVQFYTLVLSWNLYVEFDLTKHTILLFGVKVY